MCFPEVKFTYNKRANLRRAFPEIQRLPLEGPKPLASHFPTEATVALISTSDSLCFAVLEFHIIGTTQEMFCMWLLSLRMMS